MPPSPRPFPSPANLKCTADHAPPPHVTCLVYPAPSRQPSPCEYITISVPPPPAPQIAFASDPSNTAFEDVLLPQLVQVGGAGARRTQTPTPRRPGRGQAGRLRGCVCRLQPNFRSLFLLWWRVCVGGGCPVA
jgi:hypothetical protein